MQNLLSQSVIELCPGVVPSLMMCRPCPMPERRVHICGMLFSYNTPQKYIFKVRHDNSGAFICLNQYNAYLCIMIQLRSLIPLIIFTVFFSCSGNRYHDSLIAADSISDSNPQKATAILDSVKPQMKNAADAVRNYYALLRIKTGDKAYVTHKSDTTILRLVDYYEHGGDKALLPMVYYYGGMVYFDLNNYQEALRFFQKATEMSGEENPLTYKAYSQMGYIFLYQDLYDKGIEAFTKAYNYNKKLGNKDNQIYDLGGIANCYQKKKEYVKALRYLQEAMILAKEKNDNMMFQAILAQIANAHYENKEFTIAKDYIQQALKYVNEKNVRSIYSIAADIYKELGKDDSVFLLCNELYKMNDVYAKHFASKNLGHYFLDKHDASRAIFYLRQYELFSDSIQAITQTQAVAKANSMYNYQLKENVILKNKIKERKYFVFIISFLAVSAIIIFVLYILYIKKRRMDEQMKMQRRIRLLQQEREKGKAFIEENKKKIEELNIAIGKLEDGNCQLKMELSEEKEKLGNITKMTEIKKQMRNLSEEGIRDTSIYKKIWTIWNNRTSDNDCRLSREDWKDLDKEINRYFQNFKERITEVCKIDDHSYRVCLLLKIEMQPSGIAAFTKKSSNAISSTRKRLFDRVFGGNNSPKDWDEFIRSL